MADRATIATTATSPGDAATPPLAPHTSGQSPQPARQTDCSKEKESVHSISKWAHEASDMKLAQNRVSFWSSSAGLHWTKGGGPCHYRGVSTPGLPRGKLFWPIILPLDQGGIPTTIVKEGFGEPCPGGSMGLPTINRPSTFNFEGREVLWQGGSEQGHGLQPIPKPPPVLPRSGRHHGSN